MNVKTIGIVLETKDDAKNSGVSNPDFVYHWREPEEINIIVETIKLLGYKVIVIGTPEKLCLEINKYRNRIDFIFNLSVGFFARHRLSRGPNLYELCGIPYSGADPYTKMVSQNKHLMKSFWDKMGFSTPKWTYIHTENDLKYAAVPEFPLVVKPAHEGSSIGIMPDSLVSSEKELAEKVHYIFEKLKMPVIAEKFIEGYEYKVGIIGNEMIEFKGMVEDVKENGRLLGKDYLYFDAKYSGKYSKKQCEIYNSKFAKLISDSLKIYSLFIPVDYGTIDVRVNMAGQHYFLEFNADATLHPERTLAQCCKLNGLEFKGMIAKILKTSFKRWAL